MKLDGVTLDRRIPRSTAAKASEAYVEAQRHHEAGRYEQAEKIYRGLLEHGKSNAELLMLLGAVSRSQNKLDEAIDFLKESLRLSPRYWDALQNLGVCLAERRENAEAIDSFLKAIDTAPKRIESYIDLGNLYRTLGQLEESTECYMKALRIKEHPDLRNYIGNGLCNQGRRAESISYYVDALRQTPRHWVAHSNLLFALSHDPNLEPSALLAEHRWFDRLHGQRRGTANVFTNVPDCERRLRIGYVSPDFRRHVVMRFFEPILDAHDRTRFEVYAYAEVDRPDAITEQVQRRVNVWRLTNRHTDTQVAEQIRRDSIDILVDLGGHTGNSRLTVFTHKPAPIQVTYLGYAGTSGLATMDYRITDAIADPYGQPQSDTEKLIRLPGCFFAYLPHADRADLETQPTSAGRPITFGSTHKLVKLNEAVLDVWARLLKEVPGSRLLITRNTLTEGCAFRFRSEFESRGISSDRLILRRAEGQYFFNVYGDFDILLDAFPWSGHGMACEALWMGVPVITLCGNRFAARMCASVLTQLGLTELIAHRLEEYVAIAKRLAEDKEALNRYRTELRQRMRRSIICDGAAFTRNLEEAYRMIWHRWCAEQAARHVTVARLGTEAVC